MRIPDGPAGVPTVSASQFRTYGAAGFTLEDQEDDHGCPRLYYAKYVADEPLPERVKPYELLYGSMFHRVMYAMEEDGLDPYDALRREFDPGLGLPALEEARADLQKYVERGSMPRDKFATLAVEIELDAVLIEHPTLGEVRYRGVIDWIGVDLDDPTILHVADYKTNRSPISEADLYGDIQMRGYHWLVAKNVERWVPSGYASIVVHLDSVKFHEVAIRYSDQQIEDWHLWASAVVHAIAADEEAKPSLNTRCSTCPVQRQCPAYQALPEIAGELLGERPATDLGALAEWRERANRMRLILEKAVKSLDGEFSSIAEREGELRAGGWVWQQSLSWQTQFDMQALHLALGDRFYRIATTSKAALERETSDLPASTLAAVNAAVKQVAVGTKITRRKAN